jgi:hypothetical protein
MYQEVRDRQALIEAKAREADAAVGTKGRIGTGAGAASSGSADGGMSGLRTAFVGFTFKHKESRHFIQQ